MKLVGHQILALLVLCKKLAAEMNNKKQDCFAT